VSDELDAEVAEVDAFLAERARKGSDNMTALPIVRNDRRRIAEDAIELLAGAVEDLGGNVTVTTRAILAGWARRMALSQFYFAMCDQLGPTTELGMLMGRLSCTHETAALRAFRHALGAHQSLAPKRSTYMPVMHKPGEAK
jgi:hypothetical protein